MTRAAEGLSWHAHCTAGAGVSLNPLPCVQQGELKMHERQRMERAWSRSLWFMAALLCSFAPPLPGLAQTTDARPAASAPQRLRGVRSFLGLEPSNEASLFDRLVGASRPATTVPPAPRSQPPAQQTEPEPSHTAAQSTPAAKRPPATVVPGRGVVVVSRPVASGRQQSGATVSVPVHWRRAPARDSGQQAETAGSGTRSYNIPTRIVTSRTGASAAGLSPTRVQVLPTAAASTAGTTQPARSVQALAPAPQSFSVAGTYRLGPGDTIDIFVWRNPELSRQVPVRPDGRISLPLVGEIVAAGKSADELQRELSQRLAQYIQVPTVTVTITQIRSLVVYVIGRVGKPGPLQLDHNVTVLQAIAMAGGLAEFADKNGITILRTINGRQERIPFRYGDVVKGKVATPDIVLQAGDVIFVP